MRPFTGLARFARVRPHTRWLFLFDLISFSCRLSRLKRQAEQCCCSLIGTRSRHRARLAAIRFSARQTAPGQIGLGQLETTRFPTYRFCDLQPTRLALPMYGRVGGVTLLSANCSPCLCPITFFFLWFTGLSFCIQYDY